MSTTIQRYENPQKVAEKVVIKHYSEPESAEVEDKTLAATESHEEKVSTSGVSFEKPKQAELLTNVTDGVVETEKTTQDKIKERKDAFRRAAEMERKASQTQKEAQQALMQAKQFQELLAQAKEDPTILAQYMGVEKSDLLRKMQNKVLEINEEPKKPEEEVNERLARYEQERQVEKEQAAQLRYHQIKQNYISNNVLPTISKDPEKYPLLNMEGKENVAGFIYDIMNSHFQSTGEELNIDEVAEEIENQLTKEIEEKVGTIRKVKKFSRYFKEEEVTTPITQLSTKKTKTLSDSYGTSAPSVPTYAPTKAGLSRKQRLDKVLKKFGN